MERQYNQNVTLFLSLIGFLLILTLLWAGGNTAAIIADTQTVTFNPGAIVVQIIAEDGFSSVWPDTPNIKIWFAIYLTCTAVIGIGVFVFAQRKGFFQLGSKKLSTNSKEFKKFFKPERAKEAKRLRPTTLADTNAKLVDSNDVGSPLGTFKKQSVYSSWEDVELCIMAPRSGKTNAVAIPKILAAPGACLVTSNKSDILYVTKQAVERQNKKVWIFDPLETTRTGQDWFWDPLEKIESFDDAYGLASMFLPQKDDEGGKTFFKDSSRTYLALLILAAATPIEGKKATLGDVSEWMDDRNGDGDASYRLRIAGNNRLEKKLVEMCNLPHETFGGIKAGAATATTCLNSTSIMKWVTPTPGKERFNIQNWILNNEVLYLLSDNSETQNITPLIAAFSFAVFSSAKKQANTQPLQRLDPPIVAILDEAANICPIPKLPNLYSFLGSKGILVTTILQSAHQAEQVWGKNGWKQLWSSATIKIIGSGTDDAEMAENLSRLIGDFDQQTISTSDSKQGRSTTRGTHQKRRFTAAEIRSIPKEEALLFATGTPPVLINLAPWYKSAQAKQLEKDAKYMTRQLEKQEEETSDSY